jgi:hypothetical protein
MVYDSRYVALVDVAVPEREPTRCDIPFKWNVITCGDAKWFPYPDVKSRIFESEDPGTFRTGHGPTFGTLGPLCPCVPTVSIFVSLRV